MEIKLVATCAEELKPVLSDELSALGCKDIELLYRAVSFTASENQFYEAHLKLRAASRILMVIKEFSAKTPEMLFDQARRINWPSIFGSDKTFLIEGIQTDRGPGYMSSNEISKKVREALQFVFDKKEGRVPKVDLKEPKVVLVAWVGAGRCMISVDTSGKSMHKRGYRLDTHPAPIKETLAAAILAMVGYDGSQDFLDPMCGSGTIAIEAGMIAINKAPLIHRKRGQFGFEQLKCFNTQLWRQVQEDVRAGQLPGPSKLVMASDIDGKFVKIAHANALRARLEKHMSFEVSPFENLAKPAESGILVANLPYGERLSKNQEGEMKDFYKMVGDHLKKSFAGWKAGLLVLEESPYKFIGLHPSRKISLLNGSLKVKLLIFDLYEGGTADFKKKIVG